MRTIFTIILAGCAAGLAYAAPAEPPRIILQDVKAELTSQGGTSRISARIVNPTSTTYVITHIGSPLALGSKLLTYGKDGDGFTRMRESDQLIVPPGETLLIPNVMELRLLAVQQALTPGNEIPLTFTFGNNTGRIYRATVVGPTLPH